MVINKKKCSEQEQNILYYFFKYKGTIEYEQFNPINPNHLLRLNSELNPQIDRDELKEILNKFVREGLFVKNEDLYIANPERLKDIGELVKWHSYKDKLKKYFIIIIISIVTSIITTLIFLAYKFRV